ncbi:DUF6932 family protein [Paraburkholderia steynii]|nr:hypothetical protein [Paraburkholderia steynii]
MVCIAESDLREISASELRAPVTDIRYNQPRPKQKMSVPDFNADGLLPDGIHSCTEVELLEMFGFTVWRKQLIRAALRATQEIRKRWTQPIYVDGSFVTRLPKPKDIDFTLDMRAATSVETSTAFQFWLTNRSKWNSRSLHFQLDLPSNNECFLDSFRRVGPKTALKLGLAPERAKGIILLI